MTSGACTQVAIVRATDWATPGVFASAVLYPIISEDLTLDIEQLANDELGGCVEPGHFDDGTRLVNGSITRYLHYEGDELMLALALGATSFAAGSPNVLDILRSPSLVGQAITLFLDKGVGIWQVSVAKITSVQVESSNANGRAMVTYGIMGKAYSFGGADDFSTLSEPAAAVENYVLHRHLQYGINLETDGAISFPTSQQKLASTTVTIDNGLTEDFRSEADTEEPTRDGFGLVTGAVEVGKYEDDNRVANYQSADDVKQLWEWTGEGDYVFRLKSPSARMSQANPAIAGPGRVPLNYDFAGNRSTVVPPGMEATDTHMVLEGVTADPLA